MSSRRIPDWISRIPEDAVMNLVPRLDPDATPLSPQLREPGSRGAYTVARVAVAIVAALVVGLIVFMLTVDGAPTWPSILGAVLVGIVGLLALLISLGALIGWGEQLKLFPELRELWRTQPPEAPTTGVIIDRYVPIDDGDVDSIYIRVRLDDGRELDAKWRAPRGTGILQPQVPNVGAPVLAWLQPTGPFIVEAVDPTGSFRAA